MACIAGVGSAIGQPAQVPGTAPAPAPAAASPLAGPRVAEKVAARTLVERDMGGKLVRLDRRPEAAAIALLALEGPARERVEKALAERAKAVSRVLWANVDDFLAVQGALQAGDRAAAGPLIMKLRPAMNDLLDPPLVDRVAAALPEGKADEYRKLVGEYVEALAGEEPPGGPGAQGTGFAPPAAPASRSRAPGGGRAPEGGRAAGAGGPGAPARRVEMNLTLRELAQSLNATVNERKARTDEIVRLAEATPDQEEQIRALARAAGEKAAAEMGGLRGSPSAEGRAELMRKIMAVLNPEQRRKLTEGLRVRGG